MDTEAPAGPSENRAGGLLAGGGSQSLVSLGSFVVSLLALTALVPILVRELGATNYGAWVLTGGIANWVLVFDFGLSLSVSRFVALNRTTARAEAEESITVGLSVLVVVGAVIIAVTAIAADAWASYLGVSQAAFALRAGGIATLFVLVSKVFQSALEGSGRVSVTRVIQAGGSLLFVLGGIAVVFVFSARLVALSVFLIAQTALVCAAFGLTLVRTWGGIPLRRPSRAGWKRVLAYGLTMQGSAVLVVAVDPLSRFLVAAAAGPAAVAPVDVALRARAQLFNAALAFTRPFLPELGNLGKESGIERADAFWRRFAPVAVAAGLFAAVASYYLVPPLFGDSVGHAARSLTAVVTVMWIPGITAIIPFLFILLYGLARDIFFIQLVNGVVGIGLMAALLPISPRWAPIIGLGSGSVASTLQTVRVARRRAGEGAVFRPSQILPPLEPISLAAPILGSAAFLLPGPLYARTLIAVSLWSALAYRSVIRLIRDAG